MSMQRRTQGGCLWCETTPFALEKKRRDKKEGKGKREKVKKEEEKGKIGRPIYIRGREQVNFKTFQQENFEKKRVILNRKGTPKTFVSGPEISRGPKSCI